MSSNALRTLSDESLAGLYASGDEATQAAVLNECKRRDRKARQYAKDAARWAQAREDHELAVQAQYLAASAACNGYMLSRAGDAVVSDERTLFTMPAARAWKLASEELRNFWLATPRVPSVSTFDNAIRASNRRPEDYATAA
jgi:hypothetical protein